MQMGGGGGVSLLRRLRRKEEGQMGDGEDGKDACVFLFKYVIGQTDVRRYHLLKYITRGLRRQQLRGTRGRGVKKKKGRGRKKEEVSI